MKLLCIDTGQKTKITVNEFGEPEISEAADRLVIRSEGRGYFAGHVPDWDRLRWLDTTEFTAEICCAAGDLTEHTGRSLDFRVID